MVCKVKQYLLTEEIIEKVTSSDIILKKSPIIICKGPLNNQVLKEKIKSYENLFGECGVLVKANQFFCTDSNNFITPKVLKLNNVTTKYLGLVGANNRQYPHILAKYEGLEIEFYIFPKFVLSDEK